LVDGIEDIYPYVCTCREDVYGLMEMVGITEDTLEAYGSCGETDYDQCWYPTLADDGVTNECGNCEWYYYDSDLGECVTCETAIYDTDTTSYSCSGDCGANYSLNVDVCDYDCTGEETDADGNKYCKCDGYEHNGVANCEVA
jgi:hypothetical protein